MSASYDKYSVTQYSVSSILGYIEAGDIAIPEIQRPFVWKGRQVRDLIDSLYNGYPTGYLIIWQNPDVKLKDGGSAVGKKVLIDGQQRITALMTAIAGYSILTESYEEKTIRIAFNPLAKDNKECFAVTTPAHINSTICFIVLIQNSKGGGLASGFSSSNAIMGVRKTTDFLEKATWGLAIFMVVMSIATAYVVPRSAVATDAVLEQAQKEQQTNPYNLPAGTAAPQTDAVQQDSVN